MKRKRIGSIVLLTIVMCTFLCSCGKSPAAADADSLILEIGEVTLENKEKIVAAEKAVEALTESEFEQLEQIALLDEARSAYNQLLDEKAITEIEAAINEIGEAPESKGRLIRSARNRYNLASDEVKARITNYAILEQAEKELRDLKVQNVIGLINQIGQVTLNSREKIDDAQDAYNSLDYQEKLLVTNSADLEAASTRLAELEEAEKQRELQQALSSLRQETDKVEGVTWYKPSTYPYYVNSRSYVLPYIGQSGSSVWLRLRSHYTGSDWLFFERITISVDGHNYYKTYDYFDVERDNGSGDVWEWIDISPADSDIEMLKEIVNSKETIVRFQGDHYHYDLTISSSDKSAIDQVLIAYEKLEEN